MEFSQKARSKIITLKSVKGILKIMGILLSTEQMLNRSVLHYVPNLVYNIPLMLLLHPLLAYFYVNVDNLTNATDAFYVIAATIMCISQYWFLMFQKVPLWHLFSQLQHLVDQRRHSTVFHCFIDVEKKINKFTNGMKAFVTFSSSICLFLPIIYAGMRYARGKYTPNDWYLPYKTIMPYDDTTIAGYTLTFLIQLIGSWVICAIICTVTSLFFGICWYIQAMLLDLKSIFEQINVLFERPTKYQLEATTTELIGKKHFKYLMETHLSIIRFMENYADLMSGTIFVTFGISITWICTSLFQIHSHLEQMSYMLLQSIMTTSAIVLITFIFCYFGNLVTTECELVAEHAYDSLWYQYPVALQKYSMFIMARSQYPFYITGYKMTKCLLSSFSSIINRAFSFFMVFRSMNTT